MRLSFKISLLASVVSIFFILLVFFNIQKGVIKENKYHIVNDYKSDLNQLKNSFDLILKKSTDAVYSFSMLRKDIFMASNQHILKKRFENFMQYVPTISRVKLINLQGYESMVVSNNRLFEKIDLKNNYKDQSIFQNALKNSLYYSDIYFEKDTNEMMIDIAKTVQEMHSLKVIGVIIFQITLKDIQEVISSKLVNGNGIALQDINNDLFLYKSYQTHRIDEKYLKSKSFLWKIMNRFSL